MIWGAQPLLLNPPEALSGPVEIGGFFYPAYRLVIIAFGVAVAGLLYLLVARSRVGMWVRAGAANREMTEALGVNVQGLFTAVFVFGAALCALAGGLLLQVDQIGRGVVQPPRQQRGDFDGDRRVAHEELDGVVDDIGAARGQRLDRRRERHVQQHAHLAEHRTWFVDIADLRVLAHDLDLAVELEHGNRHTAIMHSRDVKMLTKMGREIQTTIFVKNGPSFNGIGIGGEGYATFTIAGPTGEGLTRTRNFARTRRCVMVDDLNVR